MKRTTLLDNMILLRMVRFSIDGWRGEFFPPNPSDTCTVAQFPMISRLSSPTLRVIPEQFFLFHQTCVLYSDDFSLHLAGMYFTARLMTRSTNER